MKNKPRIYVYKITFEEVPYFYYGVHKEKRFNESYFGTPITNKWCWEFYTPKKQILQVFSYDEEGWKAALDCELSIIRYFLNKNKWCLNESCGGLLSLKAMANGGKIAYEKRLGIYSLAPEERSEISKKAGKKGGKLNYEKGLGCFSLTPEQLSKNGKKGGKKGGKTTHEKGLGIHSLTPEQLSENGKKTNSQRWRCTVTGYETTSGPLSHYQKKRDIDPKNRVRIHIA